MPRNISFSLPTDQIRKRTKTVTRRKGWLFLKVGDVLNACVKCQGLKPGEQIEKICQIRVTSMRRESLDDIDADHEFGYANREVKKEGFPSMSGIEFVTMFLKNMGGSADQEVTRIEFEYIG